ncbi:hypothetical protein JVU11DRAFT_5194 [Chiua virens]|nr:hypothetical protein JVU11DRAFT_5194 [Chiua virens]
MSPRRMDISSLLRDPSPPRNDHDHRPRSIDALIHHTDNPPSSLLSLLNRPQPSPPPRPILGFDALVHVASEERRRINAALDRPRSSYDPSKHHSFPPFPDNFTSHRSPSPDFRFPFAPTSPTTRPHHSASPVNTYPTLRRQYIDPPRSAPLPDDTHALPHLPSTSLHHTSPYLPSFPTPHASPRNISPHRHSPQHLRSHHYSSPVQSASALTEPGVLSPRYSLGPRMAGGIEVLSHDPSSIRDQPRPDLPNYQSTGRDVFAEHPWQETQKLSPLSAKTFSLDDKYQLNSLPRMGGQETVLPRERAWARLPHVPLVDGTTTDDGKVMDNEPNFISLHDHRPTRVWEEQPRAREISRRVSPPHMPGIVSRPLEGHPWSGPSESGYNERLVKEDQAIGRSHPVQEGARTSLQSNHKEPPPPSRSPTPDPTASDLPTPFQGSCMNTPLLPPVQSQSPVQSESQTYVPQPTACVPASPIPDVDLNSGTESEIRPNVLIRLSTRRPVSHSRPRT